jgi:hypothetical protein
VLIAGRREYLTGRRRLAVAPGVNLTTSRVEPVGLVQLGWACVAFWNTGGRPLAVERAGFQYLALQKDTGEPCVMRAMINIGTPIEAAVDGPTKKVYTPLGPMLAAGIHPFDLVEAIAITTGGREWCSPPQPLMKSVPSVSTAKQLSQGLEQLRESAEQPPVVGSEVGLHREDPYLLDEPPDPV